MAGVGAVRRIWIAAGVIAALLGGALAPADAAKGKPHKRPVVFTGSCQATGTVHFNPALTNTPRFVKQRISAPGACSGTLVGRYGHTHQLANAKAIFAETSQGDSMSCLAGIATGSGTLTFHWGVLHFAFAEHRASATPTVTLTGRKSGSAQGFAAPDPSQNPADAVKACGGSGLKKFTVDASLRTTPSISG